MPLSTSEYLAGLAYLLPTLGACVAAGWIAAGRRAADLTGTARGLAVFLVASGAVVWCHLIPTALGLLSRPAVCGVAFGFLACALVLPVSAVPQKPAVRDLPPEPRASRLAAGVGVAGALVGAVAFLHASADEPVTGIDALATHLPAVARFIQSGSLWQLIQYPPDLSGATYPQNGTILMLAAVLPWESTFAVRYVDVPFLAAMAVAVWALATEVGAPRTAGALGAAATTTLVAVSQPGLEQAQVDAPMLAWFAIGALFLVRSARGAGRAELVLAGTGLGLAFGTKWYAVAYVPLLLSLWLLARLRAGRTTRATLVDAGILVGTVGLTGGFWLVRNLVLTGNPVHPAPVEVFGVTLFDAPPDPLRDLAGFTVSDYLFDAHIWRQWFIPAYRGNFGLLGPVLLVAGVVAALRVAMQWRRGLRPRAPAAVVAAGLGMGILYTVLPDTAFGLPGEPILTGANARYLVPALLAGAVLASWLTGGVGRARWLIELALFAGLAEGVRRSYAGHVSVSDVGWAFAAVAAGCAVWLATRERVAIPVVAGVATLVLCVGGWALPDRAGPGTYGALEPTIGWLQDHHPTGARVAIGKTWSPGDGLEPTLPLFGPRLGNQVEYLGRFVDGTLRSWTTQKSFEGQLRSRSYDAIVLGTGVPARPRGEEPEAGWARAMGYREVARSRRLVLLAR